MIVTAPVLCIGLLVSSACIFIIPTGQLVWPYPEYRGVVQDSKTQEAVAGALVKWLDRGLSLQTADDGFFVFPGKTTTKHVGAFSDAMQIDTFIFSHPEYREKRVQREHVKYDHPTLDLGAIFLDPLEEEGGANGTPE